ASCGSPSGLQAAPRFARQYTLVVFEGHEPYTARGKIWVRKDSPRIGIRASGGRIVVPAFLMNGAPGSVARLGQTGRLILPVSTSQPARLHGVELPRGRWRLEAEPSRTALQ